VDDISDEILLQLASFGVFAGELFAQCPVESYPSSAIEQVLDSSRYFVLRIQDGGSWQFLIMLFTQQNIYTHMPFWQSLLWQTGTKSFTILNFSFFVNLCMF